MTTPVSLLLELYKEASKRSRRFFLVLGGATILLLIILNNARFSWFETQKEVFEEKRNSPPALINNLQQDSAGSGAKSINNLIKTLEYNPGPKKYESIYIAHQTFDIPVLGVEIYIQDLSIIASFVLAILFTVYFYARRRENSILKEVLLFSSSKYCSWDGHKKATVYKSTTLTEEDKKEFKIIYYNLRLTTIFNSIKHLDLRGKVPRITSRKVTKFLLHNIYFIPVLLLATIYGWDVIESYFNPPQGQLYAKIRYSNNGRQDTTVLLTSEVTKLFSNLKYARIVGVDSVHANAIIYRYEDSVKKRGALQIEYKTWAPTYEVNTITIMELDTKVSTFYAMNQFSIHRLKHHSGLFGLTWGAIFFFIRDLVSLLLVIYCFIQAINARRIIGSEHDYKTMLENMYSHYILGHNNVFPEEEMEVDISPQL